MTDVVDPATRKINYSLAIGLDAENLAELGNERAYVKLLPHLATHGVQGRPLTEIVDGTTGSYHIEFGGRRYAISGPTVPAQRSRGLAAYALFDIVNRQLAATDVRLYALSSGEDLHGTFLTAAKAQHAWRNLPRRDWPHQPTSTSPWTDIDETGTERAAT